LTTNPGWFAVPAFGTSIALIGKGNSVRPAFAYGRPNPQAAPATVSGESFLGTPLGFLDKAREGEEGF